MSIFSKARTIVLGTTNDLLDKVIDMNSPTMLRQYVRDLEDAEAKLRNEAAMAAGGIRTLTREKGDLESRLATETTLAKKFQAEGNTALARTHASAAVTLQTDLKAKTQELADQTTTSQNLDAALAKVDAKHTDMVNAVRRLESLDRTTKAKEQAASTLQSVAAATASGSSISIDSIQDKMQRRADVADEKFDRAMADPSMADDPTQSAAVDDFLAGLK